MAIFLGFIALGAIFFSGQNGAFLSVILAVGTTFIADYCFIRLRKIQPFVLSAALVSGLIIGLLAYPLLPWYYLVSVCLLAMASKNFLKMNNRHVFNPAAFGLVVGGLIFSQNVSWWGVIFQSLKLNPLSIFLFILILVPGYISIFRMRRGRLIVSFLIIFTLTEILLRFNSADTPKVVFSTLLSPLVLFFSMVMLPEPMTSPNNRRLQIFFGAFVGILAAFFNFFPFFFLPDTLLVSLLVGNLVFYWLRQKYP